MTVLLVACQPAGPSVAPGGSLGPTAGGALGNRLQPVGPMLVARAVHTETTLSDGRVLIAGGCTTDGCTLGSSGGATAELFDPLTRRFSATGRMLLSRDDHRAVLLNDGRVLVAGGWTASGVTAATELYDPGTGRFTAGPMMHSPRAAAAAITLRNGRVLLLGGSADERRAIETTELFDPSTNTFMATGRMAVPRAVPSAALLPDGRVLVAGGLQDRTVVASAEVYDPATGSFSPVGSMGSPRYKSAAVTLLDGSVLVIGGSADIEGQHVFSSTERYEPATRSFAAGPALRWPRYKLIDSVVRLANGDVLVAGGGPQAEILEHATGRFRAVDGELGATRLFLTAAAVNPSGALLVGGYDRAIRPTAQAWLFAGGASRLGDQAGRRSSRATIGRAKPAPI